MKKKQDEPEEVLDRLKSQITTLNGSNNKRGMHIKKMPYAFTVRIIQFRYVLKYFQMI